MADRFDLINIGKSVVATQGGAAANVNFDSNTLVIDGVNNRVGVGTASPASALDVVGVARISSDLLFNSGFGSTGIAYGCRAWVNFNGTGTVAIRASGNVTSITDNGEGDYTVNFTTALPDVNYAVVGMTSASSDGDLSTLRGISLRGPTSITTTTARIRTMNGINAVAYDGTTISIAIFR